MKLKAWMVDWLPLFLLALSFPVAFAVGFVIIVNLSDWFDQLHVVGIAAYSTLAVMFVATVVASVIVARNRLITRKGTIIPSVIAFLGVIAVCAFLYQHHRAEVNKELRRVQRMQWELFSYSAEARLGTVHNLASLGRRAKSALPALECALEREKDIDIRLAMKSAIVELGAYEVIPMKPPTIMEVRVEAAQQAEDPPNIFFLNEQRYGDATSLAAAISRQTNPDANVIVRLVLHSGVPMMKALDEVEVVCKGSNVVSVQPFETTERLLELVEKSRDKHAMYELGWRREERAVPLLCEILEDPAAERQQRLAAIYALGEMDSMAEAAIPSLIKLCSESPSLDVRKAAIDALGKMGPKAAAAIPLLIRLSSGAPGYLRYAAERALRSIQPDDAPTDAPPANGDEE